MTRLGEEPVLVFFILSGFLVGGRAFQRILHHDVDPRSYFIDRFVRILVPLLASSLLVIQIDLITQVPIPYKDIIGSLFSLQGIVTDADFNAPLWSLSYEVWFYILIGCIMIISRNKGKGLLLTYFVFAACMYVFAQLQTKYLLILFMGTLAYFLPRKQIPFLKGKIFILTGLTGISFLLLQMTSESRSFTLSHMYGIHRESATIFVAFIASLLVHHLIVAQPRSTIGIKIDKIGSRLSNFSYTLYLTHYPLLSLFFYFGFPKSNEVNALSIFYYVVAVLISLFVAYLIYLVSEKQSSLVKNFIKARTRISKDQFARQKYLQKQG